MQYFLLIAVVVFVSAQNIIQKQYNIKSEKPNVFLFSAVTVLAALAFFLIRSRFKIDVSIELIPYSLGFALVYTIATVSIVLAIRYGSLGITMLVISYSLVIPMLYGVLILKEKIGMLAYIGIGLLLISLFLLNAKKEKVRFSFQWLLALVGAFMGNGLCSTIQKMQQLEFNGDYKNEFMIVALAISAVILLLAAMIQKGGLSAEKRICYAIPVGIANGMANLLVMLLTSRIPNAILFPVVSAGGIALSFAAAVFVYHEKISPMQYVGYAMGTASVILLNL